MRPKPEKVEPEVVEVVEEVVEVDAKAKKAGKKGKKGQEEEEVVVEAPPPDEYDVALAATLTLTMKNGHIVKFLPNGDVL